jgi:predicted ATP-dependent serine protease
MYQYIPGGYMWNCQSCGQRVDDTFEACWNCRTWKDGSPPEDPNAFQEEAMAPVESENRPKTAREINRYPALLVIATVSYVST